MSNSETLGKLTAELKAEIDSYDYLTLLRLWRFGAVGHDLFIGETGDYFREQLFKKKAALSNGEQVAASKNVGL